MLPPDLNLSLYYLLVRLNSLFHPLGIGGLTKLSALGGENLHLPTEEAMLPLNNHNKMSRKPKDGQLITFFKDNLLTNFSACCYIGNKLKIATS